MSLDDKHAAFIAGFTVAALEILPDASVRWRLDCARELTGEVTIRDGETLHCSAWTVTKLQLASLKFVTVAARDIGARVTAELKKKCSQKETP